MGEKPEDLMRLFELEQAKKRAFAEMTHEENQMFLMRVMLGLAPYHDVLESVRILYDEGREAFEKVRGEPSKWAAEWRPASYRKAMADA